jgi:hypothetical protein
VHLSLFAMTVNILLGARYLEKSGYKTQENES